MTADESCGRFLTTEARLCRDPRHKTPKTQQPPNAPAAEGKPSACGRALWTFRLSIAPSSRRRSPISGFSFAALKAVTCSNAQNAELAYVVTDQAGSVALRACRKNLDHICSSLVSGLRVIQGTKREGQHWSVSFCAQKDGPG
jgi:hypothetical protein